MDDHSHSAINNKLSMPLALKHAAQMFCDIDVPAYWIDNNGKQLGMNKAFQRLMDNKILSDEKSVGLASLYSEGEFRQVVASYQEVLRTHAGQSKQEVLIRINGSHVNVTSTKLPLFNAQNQCIGVVNLCTNLTEDEQPLTNTRRSDERDKIFENLKNIASSIPVPFFWSDLYCRYLGVNKALEASAHELGYEAPPVGKTPYEFHPKDIAHHIVQNQRKVIKEGRVLSVEEAVYSPQKKGNAYFRATIAPILDGNDIIGTYCVSVDITAEKEAEQLRLKDQARQITLEQQERFKRIVSQAVHDIRSPLASMMMVIKAYADKMPEKPRTILDQAVTSVNAISDGLMTHWSTNGHTPSLAGEVEGENAKDDVILVALAVSQLLTSKYYEYQQSSVTFSQCFSDDSHFSSIKGNLTNFKRMLSNVINNAIGAYDGEDGQVRCELETVGEDWVVIRIIDHGKGMPAEVLNKVRSAVSVTSGKDGGHGIGLTQVHDTVHHLQGKLEVESVVGQGTTMTFSFPQIEKPNWLANGLTFRSNDTIIVLDDDESIHQAWKDRLQQRDLKPYLDKHTIHFTNGQEAIDYIHTIEDKSHLFLLTDYELLKQPLNGIQVIEKTKLSRTVLVTSHYDDHKIREAVLKVGTQLLPKQLAHEVPIRIDVLPKLHDEDGSDKAASLPSSPTKRSAKVVVVDDDKHFTEVLVTTFQRPDCPIDAYHRPDAFLQHLKNYSLDTRIYLDYQLTDTTTGLEVAKQLHEEGYQHLYLLSGYCFDNSDMPDYITLINKLDIADRKSL